VTAAEAFLFHVTKQGWKATTPPRAAITAIEQARAGRPTGPENEVACIVRRIVTPGAVNMKTEELAWR
jgi:hypothetical protein